MSINEDYPLEKMDKIGLERYKVVKSNTNVFHRFAVKAGDGERELYVGSESDCEHVARVLCGAFLDGAFTFFQTFKEIAS